MCELESGVLLQAMTRYPDWIQSQKLTRPNANSPCNASAMIHMEDQADKCERIGQAMPSESPASTKCSLPLYLYQIINFFGRSGAGS